MYVNPAITCCLNIVQRKLDSGGCLEVAFWGSRGVKGSELCNLCVQILYHFSEKWMLNWFSENLKGIPKK